MAASEYARRRFQDIVAPRLDDCYALANWLCGNAADAEDIVQDAAVRALNALERTTVENPRAWVMKVTRTAALDWIARNRPKSLSFVGDLGDLELVAEASMDETKPNAEQAMIAAEQRAAIPLAIAALPSPLRETLILRDVNGLTYRDIAEATDAPVGTVMSRLHRARAMLARSLKDVI